jgi:hypothetical protein
LETKASPKIANVQLNYSYHGRSGIPDGLSSAQIARAVAKLRARISRATAAVAGQPSPRVFACEWLDPPFAAGHWVP